jgi:V8-like Glu-specific endopeptidase
VRPRSSLVLATGLALLIVPLIAAPVGARNGGPQAEQARVIAYWTPARMAAAVPRDLDRNTGKVIPRAKPGGGGGGSTVTGASWTKGGPVNDLTGKVFFHMDGGDWQCSGSVVSDGGRAGYSMVLTAGHCGVSETTGEFASNWVFMPNWDAQPATFSTACSGSLYGCWTTANGGGMYVSQAFATAGSFNDTAVTHDWSFAVVGPGGKSGTAQLDGLKSQGGVGGSYPIGFNTVALNDQLASFGYPAAGKYHGNDLDYCAGPVGQDAGTGNATWSMACDMTGGSSGGPWLEGLNLTTGAGGTLSSLNSYGYSGIRNMYGPKFNNNTSATYNAARTDSSVGNTAVAP